MELTKINTAQSMTVNDFFEVLKNATPNEFKDIVASTSPSFKAISHFKGEKIARDLIIVSLSEISKLLSFAISDEMIVECANNINLDFYDCKIDDLKLFRSFLMRNRLNTDLYRNDALVLYKLFQVYYTMRSDVYSDLYEQRNREQKEEEKQFTATLYDNAPDYYKETVDRVAEKMRIIHENDVVVEPVQKMTLAEICTNEDIEFEIVVGIIKQIAVEEEKEVKDYTLPFDFFVNKIMGEITYNARKDKKYLHELIKKYRP